MYNFLLKMVEDSDRAVLLYPRNEAKTIYANRLALSLYGDLDGKINIEQLLMTTTENIKLLQKAKAILDKEDEAVIYDFLTRSIWGEEKLTDLQLGYANPEKTQIFIKLTLKSDNRLQKTIQHLDRSHRAEGILKFDESLSMIYCNSALYQMLDSTEEEFAKKSSFSLLDYFLPEKRDVLHREIQKQLRKGKTFYIELEITTELGMTKSVALDFQHCHLGDALRFLIVSINVMDEWVKRASKFMKFHSMAQYFQAIQSLSGETIFLVDVKERILIHKGREEMGLPTVVQNFPEAIDTILHPEDVERFRQYTTQTFRGRGGIFEVRLKIASDTYRWYEIFSLAILNEAGEVAEVLGKVTRKKMES